MGLSGECGAQTRRARVERAVPKFSSPGENHRWREGKRAHELATGKVTVMTVLTQGSGVWFVMLTKACNAMIQVIWVSGTACRSSVRVPGSNPARGAPLACVFSCVALCVIVMLTFIAFIIFVCFQVALRLHSSYTQVTQVGGAWSLRLHFKLQSAPLWHVAIGAARVASHMATLVGAPSTPMVAPPTKWGRGLLACCQLEHCQPHMRTATTPTLHCL